MAAEQPGLLGLPGAEGRWSGVEHPTYSGPHDEQKHLLNFTQCHLMLLTLLDQRDFTAPADNDKWCSWAELGYSRQ